MATLRVVEPETYRFGDDGSIPNNPTLPLLVYRAALPAEGDPAAALEARFAAHGWTGGWRNGIFGFHHYHSTAHEVLGVAHGSARVRFGGERGRTVAVAAGDVVVIPAGVGHRNEGDSGDLLVVGAYPGGRDYDTCRGRAEERPAALENIRRVPLPGADPLYGARGPLLRLWRTACAAVPGRSRAR